MGLSKGEGNDEATPMARGSTQSLPSDPSGAACSFSFALPLFEMLCEALGASQELSSLQMPPE